MPNKIVTYSTNIAPNQTNSLIVGGGVQYKQIIIECLIYLLHKILRVWGAKKMVPKTKRGCAKII